MDTRRIGSLEVSVIGLGTNNFGFFMEEDAVPPVVDAALEAGITFFDTADSYLESEARLAKALGTRRDEVVIGTKFASPVDGGAGGAAPDYVRSAVERSLARLGTDRIDLYQLHRPDESTPIADTLGVLDELVTEGKVREIGCSNFSAAQLREAEAAAADGARFVSVQNQWNLLQRDDESDAVPEAERLGLGYLPYYPLASGLLSGKYTRGEDAPAGTRLVHFGERRGRPAVRPELRHRRGGDGLGRRAGPLRPRAGPRLAGRQAGGGLGHRRGDLARPGPGQRGGGHVGADPRRGGRGRRPRPAGG